MDQLLQAEYRFAAPAAVIRTYLQTPARILDYFPLARQAYPLEQGRCIISSWLGATLLETRELSPGGFTLEMQVSSALAFTPPFTAERIRSRAFFSMTEIWQLIPEESGCRLIKRWGNVVQHRLRFIPIRQQIIASARREAVTLVDGWNSAYRDGGR